MNQVTAQNESCWITIAAAGHLLYQAGLPSRLSKTRCKRDGIRLSVEGCIDRASLETYIQAQQEKKCQE